MRNIIDILHDKFTDAIGSAFPELEGLEVEVTPSTQDKFGHYQCNSAMKLSKALKNNPRAIAQQIIQKMETSEISSDNLISSLEIAGPGFINISIDPDYLSNSIQEMYEDPHLGVPLPEKPQRIVIDFSSPNVAKEMHVGHLRSTIIGDSLARLQEFLGHDVLRLNHIGDWGTQFGMLIAYMKEEVPEVFSGEQETDLISLMHWYRSSKKRFDEDEAFKEKSKLEVVELQGGNKESGKAWEIICDISRKAYQEIYDILGVKIQERGESFYNSLLPGIVEDLGSKGIISESNGAKCVFIDGYTNREGDPLPLIIQKSDGGYNYATTDLAAIRHRVLVEKADRLIYVTDMGQRNHFAMFFKAAEMAKYVDLSTIQVDHVPFGLVLGPDGKKFKTRSGDTEKLADLLLAAVNKAREIMRERGTVVDDSELEKMARVLGIGAVKYADLSCHRTGDYAFSYERMLRFDGNTAAFLMYAYVRVSGIKRKVNVDVEDIKASTRIHLQHPSEISLGMHLRRFGETLELVSKELTPHRLTDYLYELAQKFNVFFRDCRVEGTPEQNSRLLLCETVACVMKQGLEILGLETVDRM
ncbi:MAG: arginyl-tRNA synthetase [Chlamydiales bacterium]|jgi:arginyl-tRNA synthetase